MTRIARLTTLFAQLAALRRSAPPPDLPDRLSDLFGRLRPLLAAESESELATAPLPLIDEARLRAMFAQLVGPLEQARRAGRLADVWDIAGLGRHEVRNAAALAALWNPRLCGTVAAEFLAAFLERLEPHANLPTRAELAAGYTIRTEDRPLGRADERVDIVIEGTVFLLGVEIKIEAPEGEDQLSAYRTALQARARHRGQRPALIYLSPKPPLDPFVQAAAWADLADAARDIVQRHATWRDVAAAGRSTVPRRADASAFVHQLIAQFAAHVASF